MSLAEYLAQNYLTADSDRKSKKRKRKDKDAGLKIADDDISGWNKGADEEDEDAPTIAGMTLSSKEVKKSKKRSSNPAKASWTTVGVAAPSHAQQLAADAAAAADEIIASAEADRTRAADAEDEAPEMVDTEGVFLESGARAGLQTGAQVAADMARKAARDKREAAKQGKGAEGPGETIYRDASGRIINVAMKRAEARKQAEDAARAEAEKERAARGDVQNADAERRKQLLQDAKGMAVARYADDAELNDELKEQGRWNDPAAGFLRRKKAGKSVSGKPLYEGGFQPNRYGIRPGHRWDGVDRANGFESEWFKARNRRANVEKMEYAWQMDE